MGGVVSPCIISGKPVPFARPRFSGGRGYQSPEYAAWRARAALFLRAHRSRQGCPTIESGPVAVSITAVHARPNQRPAWCPREAWIASAPLVAISRADLDNIAKAGMDALTDCGAFADDRQVCRIVADSRYAPPGAEGCVIVHWEAMAP